MRTTGKVWPAHLNLARQIEPVHDGAKPNIREYHGDLSPTHEHEGKRGFSALTLDGFQLLVLEQRRRQVAEVGVVLDDQYGSALR